MKRSAPLRRVTGLSRSTALRPRSKRVAKVYRDVRVPLVRRLLAERPVCEARFSLICTGRSTAIHERLSRAGGGSITDEANCLAVCFECHRAIHRNIAESERRGFLQRRRAG